MRTAGTHQSSRQCAALVRANARAPESRERATPARTHKCSRPHALEASFARFGVRMETHASAAESALARCVYPPLACLGVSDLPDLTR